VGGKGSGRRPQLAKYLDLTPPAPTRKRSPKPVVRDQLPKNGARDGIYRYDAELAENPVRFLSEILKLPEGDRAGAPFIPEPWQANFLRRLYGWRTPGGHRRYRRALVAVARSNGKSALGAAIGLRGLVGERIATPQVLGAGTDRENGGIIFRLASSMVRQEPRLLERLFVNPSQKLISFHDRRGSYKVISADASHAHGHHPTLLICDDAQEMDREFYQVLATSQGSYADPLRLTFMTAGFDQEGVGFEQWSYARKVIEDPRLDPELLAMIYALPEGADYTNPELWHLANPNLNVTVSREHLAEQVRMAEQIPSFRNTVLAYHFNIWVSGKSAWLPMNAWDACGGNIDLTEARKTRTWYAAVDLSSTLDLSAVAYVSPGDPWLVFWDAWAPTDAINGRTLKDKVPYELFVAEGWLTPVEGSVQDHDLILATIARRRAEGFRIAEVAFDPWGGHAFGLKAEQEGFTTVAVPNNTRGMTEGVRQVEKLVMTKTLAHGGNHLARWCLDSTTITETDAGRKPARAPGPGRIDLMSAFVMAAGRAALLESENQPLDVAANLRFVAI
jgi:phage terminase large subunit-like protein